MLFLNILTSSEIPLKVKRFKLLILGAVDLDDRKVFRHFPCVPTFALHFCKITINQLRIFKSTNLFEGRGEGSWEISLRSSSLQPPEIRVILRVTCSRLAAIFELTSSI